VKKLLTIIIILVICSLADASLVVSINGQQAPDEAQGSSLLGSFSETVICGGQTPSEPAVEIHLGWFGREPPWDWALLGYDSGIHWYDGDSGYYDFTSEYNPDFAVVAAGVTNGYDDDLMSRSYVVNGGGCGSGWTESKLGLGNPDLAGFQIDFIRLVVNNVSFSQYDGHVITDVTWEFWGVPEPTTLFLLGLGGLFLKRRRR